MVNKIKKNKMVEHVACVSDWRVLYSVCGCLENLIQGVWVFGVSYTGCSGAWRDLYRVFGCLEDFMQGVWLLGEFYSWCVVA